MKIYIVGNPLVPEDSIPLKLLPMLQQLYPQVDFEEADPNENFIPEDGSMVIDTVKGISEVTRFTSLEAFEQTRSVSPHDYDLGFHLRFIQKLHKITSVTIIGVPQKGDIKKISLSVSFQIKKFLG